MAPPPPLTRSPSPALAGEAGGTLRPLAGFWFLNKEDTVTEACPPDCFRPLAGFWFLNRVNEKNKKRGYFWFPSPCGVLVLKSFARCNEEGAIVESFRPLAGFWFLNMIWSG